MIILYIFLAIIACVLLCLSLPLCFRLEFSETLSIKMKYLFLNIDLLEKKEESKEEASITEVPKEDPPKPKKKFNFKRYYNDKKDKLLSQDFLDLLKELTQLLLNSTGRILKSIKIKEFDVYYKIGGQTNSAPLDYAKACRVVYPSVAIIKSFFKVKKIGASVDLDYKADSNIIIAECTARVFPIVIISKAVAILIKSIPYIMKVRREYL